MTIRLCSDKVKLVEKHLQLDYFWENEVQCNENEWTNWKYVWNEMEWKWNGNGTKGKSMEAMKSERRNKVETKINKYKWNDMKLEQNNNGINEQWNENK